MAPPDDDDDNRTYDAPDRVDAPGAESLFPARYKDLGRIASGGFGEVHRVEDQKLGAILAMKVLRPEVVNSKDREAFLREARLTARLQHPGIVAVQDLGTLADGRDWYTMEEVRGKTLAAVIDELHRRPGNAAFRRVIDAVMRAAQAVASAHAAGVVHLDLKPENIMIGEFGEVRVMDWGGARLADDASVGGVCGTPAYMAPEQARGEAGLGRAVDSYAFGAILYTVLAGRPPYTGGQRQVWLSVVAGPPPSVREVAPRPVPDELNRLCARAMSRERAQRYPDAAAVAEALASWLDGARRAEEAEELVVVARSRLVAVESAREEAARLDARSALALADVLPSAPWEAKLPGFRLEEAATAARLRARQEEAEVRQALLAALTRAPDHASARELLAHLSRRRLEEAEARGDAAAAVDAEAALRAHDRGQHAAWLRGDGAVSLVTEPSGARVTAFRLEEHDAELVEVRVGELGHTPLVAVPLPRGSYVLLLEAEGRAPVRYPVHLGRQEHWDGAPPGGSEPEVVPLPALGQLGAHECYIPAGYFRCGGDPRALDALSARRLWVGPLLARVFPVSFRDWLAFLDARNEAGLEVAGLVPCAVGQAPYFRLGAGGRFEWAPSQGMSQDPMDLDEPVAFVTWTAATTFADWEAARTGIPWRLPHDLEWEKLARGVDARPWPWGHRFDPSLACMQLSHAGVPRRALNTDYPRDRSVYGLRGLGGNVRSWCANGYDRGGPASGSVVRGGEEAQPASLRMVRGGALVASADLCRSSSRFASAPSAAHSVLGLRLVADWPAKVASPS